MSALGAVIVAPMTACPLASACLTGLTVSSGAVCCGGVVWYWADSETHSAPVIRAAAIEVGLGRMVNNLEMAAPGMRRNGRHATRTSRRAQPDSGRGELQVQRPDGRSARDGTTHLSNRTRERRFRWTVYD